MKTLSQKIIFKDCILLILLLTASTQSQSQGYLEGGYRAGLWLNTSGINSIVKEYNAQNPWQKFKTVHAGLGGRILYGAEMRDWTFFVGLKWLRNTQISSGIDPGTSANNYKRLVVHYGGILMGIQTNAEGPIDFGIELNAFNYYTLRYQESNVADVKKGSDIEVFSDMNPEISLFTRISLWHGITGVTLTPAIDMPIIYGKNDISDLRKKWKLYSASDAKYMRGYNVSLTLSILLGKPRRD